MPIHEKIVKDKAVSILIREIDAQRHKEEYAKAKIPKYWEWVDLEVRNIFYEGIRIGTLKCITRFNYYGYRNNIINNRLVENKCPYWNQNEIWEYII